MVKKASFFFFIIVLIDFLLFTGCKNNTNNSENTKKTGPNLTAPEVTLELSKTAPQSTVIISWTPSADAEYYIVRKMSVRDDVKDIQFISIIDANSDSLSVIDKGCESDTEYFYVVSAEATSDELIEYEDVFTKKIYENSCYKRESEIKSIKTAKSSEITLDYPKNVIVTDKAGNTNALMVIWEPVKNALYYEVYILDAVVEEYNDYFEKIAEITETSYLVEHLCNERSFCFRIRAVNGNNYSLYSAKIKGEVPKAENLLMDKAMPLINNTCENMYSASDTLWFKCYPEKGFVKFNISGGSYYNKSTLSIFSSDGLPLTNELPLFLTEEDEITLDETQQSDSSIYSQIIDYEEWIIRNIKKDVIDFSEGSEYIIRLTKPEMSSFSICIE